MTSDAARADVMKTMAIAMVMRSLMRHRPARTRGCDAEVELVDRSSRPGSRARIVSSTAAIRGAIVPAGRGKPSGSQVTFWRRLCVDSMQRRGVATRPRDTFAHHPGPIEALPTFHPIRGLRVRAFREGGGPRGRGGF